MSRTSKAEMYGKVFAAALLVGVCLMQASAITVDGTMSGLTADRRISGPANTDGGGTLASVTETTMAIGRTDASTNREIPCTVFKLPYLGSEANPFIGATFSVGLTYSYNWGNFACDVYGLGVRATSEITGGDFYQGSADPTDATLIKDSWINFNVNPTVSLGVKTLSGTALVNYLNAQYAAGTNAGKYVVIRLTMDGPGYASTYARFASADYTVDTNYCPTITYTAARNFVDGGVYADPSDANVQANIASAPAIGGGTVSRASDTTHLLPMNGGSTSDTLYNTVYPFKLPDFGEVDNPFVSVDFRMTTLNQGNGYKYYDIDLYGLPTRDSETVLGSDFYVGNTAGKPPQDTVIQSAFLVSGVTPPAIGDHNTNATGDSNLRTYLNAQYAGGSGAGKFVFLRLNINQKYTSDYTGFTAAASEYAGTDFDPLLTYRAHTVDPPPSTTVMIVR